MALSIMTPASRAADWMLTPRTRVGDEFITNPVLSGRDGSLYFSGTSDFTADLNADLSQHADNYDIALDPRLLFVEYYNQSLLDQNNQYLGVNSDYKTEKTTWSIATNGIRDTSLTSELGLTGLTNTNLRHESLQTTLGPSYQYTERLSFAAQAAWQGNHYEQALGSGLVDYRYTSLDLSSTYLLTERNSLQEDLSGGQLSAPEAGNRSNSYQLNSSLTSLLTETWTTTLIAGPSLVKSGQGSQYGVLYDGSIKYQGELTQFKADLSRSVVPTGQGVLTRRDQATLTFTYQATERLTTSLTGLAGRTRNIDTLNTAAEFSLRYYSVLGDLEYQLASNWSLSLTAEDRQQKTTQPPGQPVTAEGYRVNIGIVWTGLPTRL